MRVVIDLQSGQNGSRNRGIGRYARSLTKAMIDVGRDHEFLILLSDAFPDTIRDVRAEFEGIVPQESIFVFSSPGHAGSVAPLNAWRNATAELARMHFLAALKPDVVFVTSLFDGFWDDVIVSIDPSKDYVTAFTLYDLIPFEDPDRYLPAIEDVAAYHRRMFQAHHTDLVLPISRYVGGLAVEQLGLDPDNVVHAPCAVDGEFRPRLFAKGEKEALLDRYGITAPFVLNTSPLEYRKNIEGLIAGFASMDSAIRARHQLVIVGKFDNFGRRHLNDIAKREGLADGTLVLTGFVSDEDLVGLYSSCALFAFPSLSEGFGLPVLEAMACGAPVIGSSTTSIPEVIGREDLLCDPRDASAIAKAMEHVLGNPGLRESFQEYGIERAKGFTWRAAAESALSAFEERHLQKRASQPIGQQLDTQSTSVSRARPQLAYATPTMSAAHRLASCNGMLLKELSRHFVVTLICLQPDEIEADIAAIYECHTFEWFMQHSGKFHDVLYALDRQAPLEFIHLMTAIPGAVLLFDGLQPEIAGNNAAASIDASLQNAVLAERGFEGIAALTEGRMDAAALDEIFVSWLVGMAHGPWFAEATCIDSQLDPLRLPSLPVLPSEQAAHLTVAKLGLQNEQKIIVAFAADDADRRDILNAFRASRAGRDGCYSLVLYAENAVSATQGRDDGQRATHLFGNVVDAGAFDLSHYRGVLSATTLCIASSTSVRWLTQHLSADAAAIGLAFIEFTPGKTDLKDAIDTSIEGAGEDRSDTTQITRIRALREARQAADIIHRTMSTSAERKAASARVTFAQSMPVSVKGIRPDANDLGRLAIALSRNEAINRAPVILFDISSFAATSTRKRLDAGSKVFLKNLFGSLGPNARAVYAQEDQWIVANQFVGKLMGLRPCGLEDQPIAIRPGDRIVGLDFMESFQPIAHSALASARNSGAMLLYNCIGYLPLESPELARDAAALVIAWADSCRGSVISQIWTAGTVTEQTSSTAGHLAALNTLRSLTDRDIGTHIMVSDACSGLPDTIAAELRIGKVILPGDVALMLEKLTAARSAPAALHMASSAPDVVNFVITGHMVGSYSLAIINRNLARTLEEAQPGRVRFLPVETDPINHTEGVPAAEKPLMMALSTRSAPSAEEIVISHHYPVLVPKETYRLSLAVFFWEETHVPVKTIDVLERGFDAILSPASSVTKALLDSGLSIPVATIGQPVDMTPYRALADVARSGKAKRTFLHISSCFRRKGVDVLLAAWARAFANADPVRLVIKTFPNPHNDVEQQVAALRERYPALAEIEIVNRDVEAEDMLQYYTDADVMVLPSRGEGYNLPALEAMSAGVPLIVTGFGGHRDFCGSAEARLLKYAFAPTASHVGGGHSMWVEPDLDDLVLALREMMDASHQDAITTRRDHARKAAAIESDRGAWLRRNAGVISDLLGTPPGGPPRVAWISTWKVQCGIAQYSEYFISGLSASQREKLIILSDERTKADASAEIAHDPLWVAGNPPKARVLAQGVLDHKAEAIVIQHQDGLISWQELGRMGMDPAFNEKVTIAVLHNARNMRRLGGKDLAEVLDGLSRLSRVVVHNVADVNYLLSLGLKQNVTLIPHGAFAPSQAPWPRSLDREDTPVIGCHGFFFRHKGIDKLILAAAELRKEWPKLRLRLVNARFPDPGHDVYIDECRMLASRLGMTDAIDWHLDFLPKEEINQLLSGCDMLVLPYDESDDSASGAVRVSLSSMVPLVATRVQIFAELDNAVAWAQSNAPSDLVDTLAPLLRSPEKRRTVQASMHDWLADHDWAKVAGIMEGMIGGLVRQKRMGWGTERH